MFKKVISIILIIVILYLGTVIFSVVAAENFHKRSLVELSNKNYDTSLIFSDKAIKCNEKEAVYFVDRARIRASKLSNDLKSQKVKYSTNEKYIDNEKTKVLDDVFYAIELNPQNLVTKRNVLPILYLISFYDLSAPLEKTNLDPKYVSIAKDYFSEMERDYPNDLGVLAQIAQFQKDLFLENEFRETSGKIKLLRPEILDWYIK